MNMIYRHRGILSVFFGAVCFSFAGVLIKMIDWPAVPSYGGRSFFTFFAILGYMVLSGHRIYLSPKIILGAVIFSVMNNTITMSTLLTTAGNAIMLQFTMPLFIILFTWMIFRKRPGRLEVLCSIGVFIGMICFFLDQLSGDSFLGNILGIVSGICCALVYMMKQLPGFDYDNSLLWSCVLSFLIGIPYYGSVNWSFQNIFFIFIAGFFQTGAGFILMSFGLDLVSPIAAALTSTIEPILTPFFSFLFLGEFLSPFAMVGAVIVLATSLIYNISAGRKQPVAVADTGHI